jgi:autotransporter-associated beta strand protein
VAVNAASTRLTFGGAISGAGALTKNGSGILQISGSTGNTYTGLTTVSAGTLELNKSSFDDAVPGNLTINSGGTVRLIVLSQIANNSTVTVNTGGTLDLNGHGEVIGPLTVNGGSVTIGTGILTAGPVNMTGGSIASTGTGRLVLQGNVTTNTASAAATINGTLNLNNSSTHTFTVVNGPAVPDLDISAVIVNGGLTKDGVGTLSFSGSSSNTYTGLTTVTAGTLELNKTGGAVALAGDLTINNLGIARELSNGQIADTSTVTVLDIGGSFDLSGHSDIIGPLIVNNSSVTIGSGTLTAGPVTMTRGSIASTGTGKLVLQGDLTANSAVAAATIGGTLDLGAATRVFTVAAGGSGLDFEITALIQNGGLTKAGTGTMRLTGSVSNTFAGDTTVSTGRLLLNNAAGTVAVPGNLIVTNGGIVREDIANQIADAAAVTVNQPGIFDLNGLADTIGPLTVTGGGAAPVVIGTGTLTAGLVLITGGAISSSGAGALVLQGNLSANVSPFQASIGGNVNLGGVTRTVTVAAGGAGLVMTGVISNGGLTKAGAGTLQLSGASANAYTGTTTVSAGTLELNHNPVGGSEAIIGNLTINSGGTVRELAGAQIVNTSSVSVDAGGMYVLNDGVSEDIGALTVGGSVTVGAGGGLRPNGTLSMTGGSIISTGTGLLTLQGNVTTSAASSIATISGNLDLGGATRTFTVADGTLVNPDLEISAVISNGGVTKQGAGTVRFSGSAANTYIGPTTVSTGNLELFKTGALAVPANLIVNGGIVREMVINQIADSSSVTVNEPGVFELNGLSDTIGSLAVSGISSATTVNIGPGTLTAASVTMTGGSIFSTGAGKLVLQGDVTTNAALSVATIGGNLDLGSPNRTFTVADGPSVNTDLEISAVISAGGMIKQGAGTLRFDGSAANTYTGQTVVSDGLLQLTKTGGALAVPGNLTINFGGTLQETVGNQIADAAAVTCFGTFDINVQTDTVGLLTVDGGSVTLGTGTLTVTSVSMIGGSIASTGTGKLVLQGDVATNASATNASISGNLDLGGVSRTFTVAEGAATTDLVVSAVVQNGGLTKAGAGALSLVGASNTYAGLTTVSAGTLELAKGTASQAVPGNLTITGGTVRELSGHQIADTSAVTINTGGTFDLNGAGDTVGSVTVTGGTLTTVSATAGRLTAGNTSLNAASTLAMKLVDTASSDRITVNGTAAIGGNLQLSAPLAIAIGAAITLIDNDGADPVTGTFANLAQGVTFLIGNQLFSISYSGGTGNDVVVTRTGGPTVLGARVNDGSAQRSRVTSLTVTFSAAVNFVGSPFSAFMLTRNGGGAVIITSATSIVVNGLNFVTLSNFTGSETEFGSLKDGRYTLTALASQINQFGFALDGNGDGTAGDDFTFGDSQGLFRFYGDINGDRHVDIADFALFSSSFNLSTGQTGFLAAFDFNADGHIDIADFGQFSIRFFTLLP